MNPVARVALLRIAFLRGALLLVAVAPLAALAVGCGGTTYDGSTQFYDQHPEYKNQPSYMHPSDSDDTSDEHPARPW